MPVTVDVNSIATVRLEHALGNDVAYNVLHYRLASITVMTTGLPAAVAPLASDSLPGLALTAFTTYTPLWKAAASAQVQATGCTVQKTFPDSRSIPYHYTPVAPVDGEIAGDALPLQDSVTILKKTGYGERWGMGRFFFVGIPEAQADAGRVTAPLMTLLGDLADWIAGTLTYDDGTYSYLWKPVVTSEPATMPTIGRTNPIERAEVSNDIIKSQKRRRPGKGI